MGYCYDETAQGTAVQEDFTVFVTKASPAYKYASSNDIAWKLYYPNALYYILIGAAAAVILGLSIAIAVVRQSGGADANVTAAISVSDNAAAEAMWASLGDPATAAAATDQVLRDGGDATTNTNPERIRPEYTAFGQTQWALPDQAQFGANLTCLDGAGPVVGPEHLVGRGEPHLAHALGAIDLQDLGICHAAKATGRRRLWTGVGR